MAGEIEQPEVVFPKAIAILIPTLATVRSIDAVRCPSVRPSVLFVWLLVAVQDEAEV